MKNYTVVAAVIALALTLAFIAQFFANNGRDEHMAIRAQVHSQSVVHPSNSSKQEVRILIPEQTLQAVTILPKE